MQIAITSITKIRLYVIFLRSIRPDENKALARTFIPGLSVTLAKTLQLY